MKRDRRAGVVLAVLAIPFFALAAALGAPAPRSAISRVRKTAVTAPDTAVTVTSILGVWHGHSDCLQKGTACHDEIVEYHFEPYAGHPDSVWLDAKKLVAGRYASMGAMGFAFDRATRTWSAEIGTSQGRILWSFQIAGRKIVGSLVSLPDRTPLRYAEAVPGIDPKVKEGR